MSQETTLRIISPDQYNTYTAAWLKLIGSASDDELQQAFEAPEIKRLTFVSFSNEQLLALASTVGVSRFKARFALVPDATGLLRFSAALFTTDADGQRLSAYHLAQPVQPGPGTEPAAPTVDSPTRQQKQVPRELAMRWLTDWTTAKTLKPAMFNTTAGTLQGYEFELDEVLNALFAAQPTDGKSLLLNFGLHTYYGPEATTDADAPTQAFGLVLYLNTLRAAGSLAGLPSGNDFYNFGGSCPPNN